MILHLAAARCQSLRAAGIFARANQTRATAEPPRRVLECPGTPSVSGCLRSRYTDYTLSPTQQNPQSPAVGDFTGNPMHIDDLDISPAEDGYIIHLPEQDRVHFLNPTAVLILELCNGNSSVEEIIQMVKDVYQLEDAPDQIVKEAIARMKAEGLLL